MKRLYPLLSMISILMMLICNLTGCAFDESKTDINETFNRPENNIIVLDKPDSVIYPEFYDWVIEVSPSDLTVNPIADHTEAAETGQHLWLEELGDDANPGTYVEVFYVAEEDTWVVLGTSPEYGEAEQDWVGSVPIAIMKSDGTVLSVFWV